MTITLTPEHAAIIQRKIDSGHFRDADQVILTALETLSSVSDDDLGICIQEIRLR